MSPIVNNPIRRRQPVKAPSAPKASPAAEVARLLLAGGTAGGAIIDIVQGLPPEQDLDEWITALRGVAYAKQNPSRRLPHLDYESCSNDTYHHKGEYCAGYAIAQLLTDIGAATIWAQGRSHEGLTDEAMRHMLLWEFLPRLEGVDPLALASMAKQPIPRERGNTWDIPGKLPGTVLVCEQVEGDHFPHLLLGFDPTHFIDWVPGVTTYDPVTRRLEEFQVILHPHASEPEEDSGMVGTFQRQDHIWAQGVSATVTPEGTLINVEIPGILANGEDALSSLSCDCRN